MTAIVTAIRLGQNKKTGKNLSLGAGDRGRTGTVSLPPDFESGTSANSITPARSTMLL